MDTISLNPIILRIDLHLRPDIIKLHILLANIPTVLNSLDSFLKSIGGNCAGRDGSFGDEEDGCLRDERCEHGPADDGLYGWDGGVGIALFRVNL